MEVNTMNCQCNYDIKDDFIELLHAKNNFSGVEELKHYYKMYCMEASSAKRNLMKFCIYRLSSNLADSELKSFDCDVCKRVIESFPITYRWLNNFTCTNQKGSSIKYEVINGNRYFRGDTMTSAWTILKGYVKLRTSTYTIGKNDTWELFILRNVDRIPLSDAMGDFLQLVHSIGNFMPVPRGFNTGRSNFGKWDSWDLTLNQLYQWYKDNTPSGSTVNNQSLEKLFEKDSNKQNSILSCQTWLESFDTWAQFVKENYLDSFLHKNGTPKAFFENHSLTNPTPKTIIEYETFLQTVNACIISRGNSIINFLSEKEDVNVNREQFKSKNSKDAKGIHITKLLTQNIKKLKDELKSNPVDNLGRISSIIAVGISVVYAIILWMKFVLSGGYTSQIADVKQQGIGKIVNFRFDLLASHSNSLIFKIVLALIVIALLGICIKGAYQRIGIKRKVLMVNIVMGWLSIVACGIGWMRIDSFLHSEQGFEWSQKVGYDSAVITMNKVLFIGRICLIAAIILWILSIAFTCFMKSTRRDTLYLIKVSLLVCIGIPVLLIVAENILGILFLIITAIVIGVISNLPIGDTEKIKLYDENGRYVATMNDTSSNIEKNSIDKNGY